MKRHGWSGQPASHGNSLTHRAMGSAGPSQGGGSRVHPGKKMAGRMGGQQVTVQNVKVIRVDSDHGILLLHGQSILFPNHGVCLCQRYVLVSWRQRDGFVITARLMACVSISGCISGPNGGVVKLQDAVKKPWPNLPSNITSTSSSPSSPSSVSSSAAPAMEAVVTL